MGFHNAFCHLFWRKNWPSLHRFQSIVQSCYCEREKMYDLSDYNVNMNKIYWAYSECINGMHYKWMTVKGYTVNRTMKILQYGIALIILSALMVSLIISYISKSWAASNTLITHSTCFFQLLHFYCLSDNDMYFNALWKKKNIEWLSLKFFVVLIHCSFTWVQVWRTC